MDITLDTNCYCSTRNLDHMKASCYQMLSCICLSALRYWLWSLWGDEPAWEASCASQRASKLHLQLEYREEETNQNFQRQHAGGTVSYNFHSCKHLQWGNSAARTLGNDKQIATDCWELTIQTYKPVLFVFARCCSWSWRLSSDQDKVPALRELTLKYRRPMVNN